MKSAVSYIQKHIMNIEMIAPMARIIAAIMSEFLTWPKINKDFEINKKIMTVVRYVSFCAYLKGLSLVHDYQPCEFLVT